MDVADDLCDELFRWIEKQEQCADDLRALAKELEEMSKKIKTGQLVGNTASVLGSATLIGAGIFTFMTGGLAAPLLVVTAGVTAGAGTVTSVTCAVVENWKSSGTMKNAEKTTNQIKMIGNNIEKLQKKLSEECGSQDLEASPSEEVQYEITARILRAMAKRNGRDLHLSHLKRLLRDGDMYTHCRYSGTNPNSAFFQNVSVLLSALRYCSIFVTIGTKKVVKYSVAALTVKTVAKGAGQVAGGALGLVLTVPDLINNCEKLIKNKHQTEASTSLKTKANEICEAVQKLKKQLSELQEMLSQIPEMECHDDLAKEILGAQR